MFDPYRNDSPGIADPASDIIHIIPTDDSNLEIGVKSLRIWNPNEAAANLRVTTIAGTVVNLPLPAESLVVEPVRVSIVHATGTSAGLVIHGYTDAA